METVSGNDVMLSLYHSVPKVKSCYVLVTNKHLDILLAAKRRSISFLWVDGKRSDPILDLWKIHKAEVMDDNCHVVFTDTRHDAGWADLARSFGGTKFGTLFLMQVSENARPSVCPSQRGMYLK